MNDDRKERREAMLAKVRKLLAMARDGRGNANEEEIAMRQASKLMVEWGIEEAEADMSAIAADTMQFGESTARADGREDGVPIRSASTWAGILSLGVARFTDTFSIWRRTAKGIVMVFQGEREDVLLAKWLFGVLVVAIQQEQRGSTWTARGDANQFRLAAAGVLQRRMTTIAKERRQAYEKAQAESGSRALVVVDKKLAIMQERFGKQRVSHRSSGSSGAYGAREAGQAAGSRINIPQGRPVGSSSQSLLS